MILTIARSFPGWNIVWDEIFLRLLSVSRVEKSFETRLGFGFWILTRLLPTPQLWILTFAHRILGRNIIWDKSFLRLLSVFQFETSFETRLGFMIKFRVYGLGSLPGSPTPQLWCLNIPDTSVYHNCDVSTKSAWFWRSLYHNWF